jgi:hypothetical protein
MLRLAWRCRHKLCPIVEVDQSLVLDIDNQVKLPVAEQIGYSA